MDLMETGSGSVEWFQLAQDRDRWRALVNMVMDLQALASYLVIIVSNFKCRLYMGVMVQRTIYKFLCVCDAWLTIVSNFAWQNILLYKLCYHRQLV
jgi:hypothetical protein